MASVELNNLTDSEIRAKFIELGVPIGPVTSTTRKILLKKLNSLLDGNTSISDLNTSKYDPRTIASSGDESDGGMGRSRRKTMPPPRTNKSPKRKSPSRASINEPLANSTFSEHVVRGNLKDTASTFTSPPAPETTFETRRSTRSSLGLNSTFSSNDNGDHVEDPNTREASFPKSPRSTLNHNTNDYKVTNRSPNYTPDVGLGLSDAFKSRLQSSGSTSYASSYASPRLGSTTQQPFASEFLRRLSTNKSSFSPGNASSFSLSSSKLLDVKESDDEDNGSTQVYTRFTQGGRSSPSIAGKVRPRISSQDSWVPFDSPISAVLLLIFSLFFVFIGVTYVNMRSADTAISSTASDLHYPLCNPEDEHSTPRVNCIREPDKELTTKIFRIIYTILHERLSSSPCLNIGDGPFGLADRELISAVFENDPTLGTWLIEHQLPLVKILLRANPKFKLTDISGGIAIINPPVPFYCSIMKNLMVVANYTIKMSIVGAFILSVYLGIRWWKTREASHRQEVFKLVSNILEIVASQSQDLDNYVPLIHVRDQLISPQERNSLEKLWNDAVEVLNSDSRVRCEQQIVEGEDCLVWRWVATSYNTKKGQGKQWKGQAFDTNEGSVNSLPNSPTSCLKIRHMFDATQEEGDDWVSTVVDAILEKCSNANILHVAVERQSREGCVYMKCATPTDAGKAYRALHGSWFDSNLVTVKYIREGRYLERFPESAKCTQPLHPSTNSRNSAN